MVSESSHHVGLFTVILIIPQNFKKKSPLFSPKHQTLLFTAFLFYFQPLTDDSIQFPMCEVRKKRRESKRREKLRERDRGMWTDPCRGGGELLETGLYSALKMLCFQTHLLQCHSADDLCNSWINHVKKQFNWTFIGAVKLVYHPSKQISFMTSHQHKQLKVKCVISAVCLSRGALAC